MMNIVAAGFFYAGKYFMDQSRCIYRFCVCGIRDLA